MIRSGPSSEQGMTLVEMLVGMVVAGIMLGALVGLFIGQSQLMGEQTSQRAARDASRSALHTLQRDLQPLESSGGVEAATADSLTIRVPFAMGVICASSSTTTTVSLFPTDSVTFANAGMSGFAWRAGDGAYTYLTSTSLTNGVASVCTGASITTVPGGSVMQTSVGNASIPVGSPVLLFQRVRYGFVPSGSRATLVRRILETGVSETLVEPFDTAGTRFRFFVGSTATAQDAVPSDLGDLTGIEVLLEGLGDRPRALDGSVASSPLVVPVFFKNRTD